MDETEKQLNEIEENLHKWFKEKWVRFGPDGKIRGACAREKSSEGKPKCRPLKSAQGMGKKARATAARRKRREDPNPDRSGKAKNVKTEEIMNENHKCPICGGELVSEMLMNEKKDACYYKVKSRYKVWPSAYASGALVKCRKKGAKNWGNKSEGFEEVDEACWKGYHKEGNKKMFGKTYPNCVKNTNEATEELDEKWSAKYKRSIDCSHPKGFSQRAHCQGRKKTEEEIMKEQELKEAIKKLVREVYEEQAQQDECWECYEAAMEEGTNEAWEECYKKTNWNMIPEGDEHTCEGDEFYEIYGDMNADATLEEAEYRGRKVKLGKPMRGDVKKFRVFVRNPKTGKVKKVNFGDPNMRIKKSNPKRRKSFRARHKCSSAKDRTSARYWSCRKW
jgi:hypothetical protein